MLSVVNQPFNPNRTTAPNTTNWVKDEFLHQIGSTLKNLSSIPAKDIRVTNKSIDEYKNASNFDIMAEIIATWNLTQFNVLSGIKNVLELNDRILHIAQDRNKVIGQCVKRLNYLEQYIKSLKKTNEMNYKLNDSINNPLLGKKTTSVTFTDIANPRMIKNEFKSTFEPISIQNTNVNLKLKEQTIQNEINVSKNKSQSHVITHNMEIPQISTKIDSASTESAEPLCKSIATAAAPLPNAMDYMYRKPNKIKIIKKSKSNIKKKKFVKHKGKKKKKKHKQKLNNKKHQKQIHNKKMIDKEYVQQPQAVNCGKYDEMIARTIENDRVMLIEQAKYEAKQNKEETYNEFNEWSFG